MQPPPAQTVNSRWPEPSQQPAQQLIITLLRASELTLPPAHPRLRPYAVLQPLHSNPSSASPSTVCQLTPSSNSAPVEQPVWNHVAIFDIFNPRSSLFISIYYNQNTQPTTAAATPSSQDQPDRLLGYTIIDLASLLSAENSSIKPTEEQKKHTILDSSIDLSITTAKKISIDDFEIIKLIGEGSYGQVYRVRKKDTRRLYAMKTLEKRQIEITKEGGANDGETEERTSKIKLERVLSERKILEQTRGSEFLVGLKFSFQTPENLNLVIFYTAEILSGLKFLHAMNIAYRDLKPENCLLDATGHVALCDFGLSKLDMDADAVTQTFCGTTEYIAPEVLLESGYTRLVDFWALGVLIFEMSVGWTPFFSENRAVRYTLILESDIRTKFPKRGISEVTKEIILCLLERDPSRRLGAKGIEEIESHGFFAGLDWAALRSKRLTPPFKPRVESDASLSYASDPIYSYGSRTSNSLRGGPGRAERHSEEDHDAGCHPQALSSNTTRTQHSRPNHLASTTAHSYQYQQQHSRRSSVENKTTGVQLPRPNYPLPNHHFVSAFDTHHLHHPPPAATAAASASHLDLALTQRQSLEDLHLHSPNNPNLNHPLHLNNHNFFKGFTFSSRDDSLIN
ncbi:hypothetical protein PtB15_2B504 [Puccinia triticina]|nr:hypothetical protein PtB15_2B504 [Puccinia triticina]